MLSAGMEGAMLSESMESVQANSFVRWKAAGWKNDQPMTQSYTN
jgi:hypothetical protein